MSHQSNWQSSWTTQNNIHANDEDMASEQHNNTLSPSNSNPPSGGQEVPGTPPRPALQSPYGETTNNQEVPGSPRQPWHPQEEEPDVEMHAGVPTIASTSTGAGSATWAFNQEGTASFDGEEPSEPLDYLLPGNGNEALSDRFEQARFLVLSGVDEDSEGLMYMSNDLP